MATLKCPHCGSPAQVKGRRWECGWCGDSGWLAEPKPQAPEKPEMPQEKPKKRNFWDRF